MFMTLLSNLKFEFNIQIIEHEFYYPNQHGLLKFRLLLYRCIETSKQMNIEKVEYLVIETEYFLNPNFI